MVLLGSKNPISGKIVDLKVYVIYGNLKLKDMVKN